MPCKAGDIYLGQPSARSASISSSRLAPSSQLPQGVSRFISPMEASQWSGKWHLWFGLGTLLLKLMWPLWTPPTGLAMPLLEGSLSPFRGPTSGQGFSNLFESQQQHLWLGFWVFFLVACWLWGALRQG